MNQNPGVISADKEAASNKAYPKIFISRPVTAPAQMAAERKHLVMIGAGSGIAPFLAFLDEEQI